MAYLSDYGGIWGAVPATAGQVFWVAPGAGSYTVNGLAYDASDGNDGLSPERAFATADAGVNAATNNGDVVVLLPGTHTPTASLAMDSAGVTLTGLPSGAGNFVRQKTIIDTVSGDQSINVTAASCEIAYLHFTVVTTDSAIDASADADQLHVHHCSFDMATAAADTGTIGIDMIGAASNVLIDHCYFECGAAQGPAIACGGALEMVIEDCVTAQSGGTWAAAITQAAAGRRLIIRRCDFQVGNGTGTVGILGTTGGEVSMALISHCNFADSITNAIDTYDAGDCEIVENYQAGLGSTDGGVLITATT